MASPEAHTREDPEPAGSVTPAGKAPESAAIREGNGDAKRHDTPSLVTTAAKEDIPLRTASPSPAPVKDPAIDASSYGTRSRNRAGRTRPNYAEDRDLDEFELEPKIKSNGRKTALEQDSASGSESATSTNKRMAAQHHESVPNGNLAPPPATTNTRKRKAITQAANNPPVSNSQSAGQSGTRRTSHATQLAIGIRDTNMLSFDNCRAKLKDQKLVADDGTTLQVNGKHFVTFPRIVADVSRPRLSYLRTPR